MMQTPLPDPTQEAYSCHRNSHRRAEDHWEISRDLLSVSIRREILLIRMLHFSFVYVADVNLLSRPFRNVSSSDMKRMSIELANSVL